VILQEVAQELGIPLTKPTTAYRHNERHWQVCNLDGWDNTNRRPAEIKNVHFSQRHLWHGQTPDHAEIQVHHSAAVTQADHAIIAGLIGGSHLIIHEIEINPNVVDMITEAEEKFWEHVTTDTPPPLDGHIRTMEAITREWAHKPGSREVTQDQAKPLWEAWAEAHEAHKEAEKNKKKYAAELAKLMDGHTSLTTGKRTWATARRGRLNMTRLSDEHPELMKEYTRKPSFDLDAFKHDHPDLYDQYRHTSIQPTPTSK
jgi:predicted phage-related endonuclease